MVPRDALRFMTIIFCSFLLGLFSVLVEGVRDLRLAQFAAQIFSLVLYGAAFWLAQKLISKTAGQGGVRRLTECHWQGHSLRERPESSHGTGSSPCTPHPNLQFLYSCPQYLPSESFA